MSSERSTWELRYGRRARIRDLGAALGAAAALALAVAFAWKKLTGDFRLSMLLTSWALAFPFILVPLAWIRWRRRVRVDDEGVVLLQGEREAVRLRWEEVEAFAQAGLSGVELRGGGRTLRVGQDVDGVGELWLRVRARCEGRILDGLRERFRKGEEIQLKVPGSPLLAQGVYWGITLLLAAATLLLAWKGWTSRSFGGLGVWIQILFWYPVLLVYRRELPWRGGWVRVGPEGLVLKRAAATWRVPWTDVVSLSPQDVYAWKLHRKSGRSLYVHPGLLNLQALGRLVGERTGFA